MTTVVPTTPSTVTLSPQLRDQIAQSGSPMNSLIGNIIDNITKGKQSENYDITPGKEDLISILAFGEDTANLSSEIINMNNSLREIINNEINNQINEEGVAEGMDSYSVLREKIQNKITAIIDSDTELSQYILTFGLSNEDYATYLDGVDLSSEIDEGDKQKTDNLSAIDILEKEINNLNSPQWGAIRLGELIQQKMTSITQQDLQVDNSSNDTGNRKGTFGNLLNEAMKSKADAALLSVAEKRALLTTLGTTKLRLGRNVSLNDIASSCNDDSEAHVFIRDSITLINDEMKALPKITKGKQTDLQKLIKDTETLSSKTEAQRDALIANAATYKVVFDLVDNNREEFLTNIISKISEGVESGDQDIINIIMELGAMNITLNSKLQEAHFDATGLNDRIKDLYDKLNQFDNEFLYPHIKKGVKTKDPKYKLETRTSKKLDGILSKGTSAVSGIMGGLGLMHMIPSWISKPKDFFLGESAGNAMQNLFTSTNGDINTYAVYGAGLTTLMLIFAGIESGFKGELRSSINQVGKETIKSESSIRSLKDKFFKKSRTAMLVIGLSATVLASWTDASGIASGLFGGKKRAAEKDKVETALKNMQTAFDDAQKYVSITDSTANQAIQTAIRQEDAGSAASGASGRGKFFTAKHLTAYGDDNRDFNTLSASAQVDGRNIMNQAQGKPGQYQAIHEKLETAIDNLNKGMLISTDNGSISWSDVNQEAEKYIGGLNPNNSMGLKDLANRINVSVEESTKLLESIATGYNTDISELKSVFDNIESIASSGKKLNIDLIDSEALQQKIQTIKAASLEASTAIGDIEPYMSIGAIGEHFDKEGWSDMQKSLAYLAIALVILLLHSIYPALAIYSLKYNKNKQTEELDNMFANMQEQEGHLKQILDKILPSIVHTGTYEKMNRIFTNNVAGENDGLSKLIERVVNRESSKRDDINKQALLEGVKSDLLAFISNNFDQIIAGSEDIINQEMQEKGLFLLDEDRDPLPYIEFYSTVMGSHTNWSRMYSFVSLIQGSETFKRNLLNQYNGTI